MSRVICYVLIWICVSAIGCRFRDPSIDLLERELRFMEDQLYMMEDELEHTCSELEACRSGGIPCVSGDLPPEDVIYDAPEILSDSPAHSSAGSDSGYEVIPVPKLPADTMQAPRIELPAPKENRSRVPAYEAIPEENSSSTPSPMKLAPPNGNLDREPTLAEPQPLAEPVPAPQEEETSSAANSTQDDNFDQDDDSIPELTEPQIIQPPDSLPEPADSGPKGAPPRIEPQTSRRGEPFKADIGLSSYQTPAPAAGITRSSEPNDTEMAVVDAHVTHIVARSWLNENSSPGKSKNDPDLFVVIEPRNQDGFPVLLSGQVAVVVLDDHYRDERADVGRWDFDAATIRRRMKTTPQGTGIHLDLNWPGTPPENVDKLVLFVRYVTVEGKELEFNVPIEQDPPQVRSRPKRRSHQGAPQTELDENIEQDQTPGSWRAIQRDGTTGDDRDADPSQPLSSIPLQPIPGSM